MQLLRKTTQYPLPVFKPAIPDGYDIYPSHLIPDNQIFTGYECLAKEFASQSIVIIECYAGVLYDHLRNEMDSILAEKGLKTAWTDTAWFLKPEKLITEMISPYLGREDPVFGKRTDLLLEDFFDLERLTKARPDETAGLNIIIGQGASLAGWKGLLVYADLPKNEIQFRARAGSITNLGSGKPSCPKEMYKRFYFVDWVALNRQKQKLLPRADIILDSQRIDEPAWMKGDILRNSLRSMSLDVIRARPWFEPGTWGGSWIKENIKQLNSNVPNYAWSFELITPENGLLLESSGKLLEVSFDTLMFHESEAVLGDCHDRFSPVFPVRFDFLDTFDGGNLSVQCHPRTEYIKAHFGEDFAQEESYYILDTKDNAGVYLGFNEDIDPSEFREALESSFIESKPVDIDKYVQKHASSKHDLFLIPCGTIHGSGKNNLVLEISSTPYIFTFKMYDWLRPDLDGRPRPLNIARGMENLDFNRKGKNVTEKLIPQPVLLEQNEKYSLWRLPTHETQLYDIYRYYISDFADVETENKCHVLNLVEGSRITVETSAGKHIFHYAETFIIPAATKNYRLVSREGETAIVVRAFVK